MRKFLKNIFKDNKQEKPVNPTEQSSNKIEKSSLYYLVLNCDSPKATVARFAETLLHNCKQHLPVKDNLTHWATIYSNDNFSEQLYKKFIIEIKTKTILLKPFDKESPKNRIFYWGAIYDTLLDFLTAKTTDYTISFESEAKKQDFDKHVAEAKELLNIIYPKKIIRSGLDDCICGHFYIIEHTGVEPVKNIPVTEKELEAIHKLSLLVSNLSLDIVLEYKTNPVNEYIGNIIKPRLNSRFEKYYVSGRTSR